MESNLKKSLLINLFAGPGVGKSTFSTSLFSKLKKLGIDAEYIPEYAKDKCWEESYNVLNNQINILGKQYHRLYRVADKVEVVVTDAPILLTIVYNEDRIKSLKPLVLELNQQFNCLNVYLERTVKYNPNGRTQTLTEAVELDKKIKSMLNENNIEYIATTSNDKSEDEILKLIIEKLNK